jgi:hypothetical protein
MRQVVHCAGWLGIIALRMSLVGDLRIHIMRVFTPYPSVPCNPCIVRLASLVAKLRN